MAAPVTAIGSDLISEFLGPQHIKTLDGRYLAVKNKVRTTDTTFGDHTTFIITKYTDTPSFHFLDSRKKYVCITQEGEIDTRDKGKSWEEFLILPVPGKAMTYQFQSKKFGFFLSIGADGTWSATKEPDDSCQFVFKSFLSGKKYIKTYFGKYLGISGEKRGSVENLAPECAFEFIELSNGNYHIKDSVGKFICIDPNGIVQERDIGGSWEQFIVEEDKPGVFNLKGIPQEKAPGGYYLAANRDGTLTTRQKADTWEDFIIRDFPATL